MSYTFPTGPQVWRYSTTQLASRGRGLYHFSRKEVSHSYNHIKTVLGCFTAIGYIVTIAISRVATRYFAYIYV